MQTIRTSFARRRFRPVLELVEARLLMSAGDLDLSFNGTGKKTIDHGYSGNTPDMIAVQTDNKIVVVGGGAEFTVTRLTTSGNLDTSFGTNVKDTLHIAGNANGVAIQSDGKIVVGGVSIDTDQYCVARLNSDGTLDTSFGTGGKVLLPKSDMFNEDLAIAIRPNGSILATSGYSDSLSTSTLQSTTVYQLTTTGQLDTNFGTGGMRQLPVGFDASATALQTNGDVVLAGTMISGTNSYFAVARLNPNGSPDTTLGSNGVQSYTGLSGAVYDVAIQPVDGRIVLVGLSISGTSPGANMVVRLNSDGTLDTSFGTAGSLTVTGLGLGFAVTVETDGKLLVAGGRDLTVARLNSNGTLDSGFAKAGLQTVLPSALSTGGPATAEALTTDGKLVVLGDYGQSVVRLLLSGSSTPGGPGLPPGTPPGGPGLPPVGPGLTPGIPVGPARPPGLPPALKPPVSKPMPPLSPRRTGPFSGPVLAPAPILLPQPAPPTPPPAKPPVLVASSRHHRPVHYQLVHHRHVHHPVVHYSKAGHHVVNP